MYDLVVLTVVEEGLILEIGEFDPQETQGSQGAVTALPIGRGILASVSPHPLQALGMFGASSFRRSSRLAFSRSKASRAGWKVAVSSGTPLPDLV